MKEIEDLKVSQGISSAITGVRDGDLAALLGRVEQAEGPDRELDFAIHQMRMGDWLLRHGYERRGDGYWSDSPPMSGASHVAGPEPFTASLDAALALCARVLPGWRPRIDNRGLTPGHEWLVTLAWWEKRRFAWGRTAPIALIAAMLKALVASPKDDTAERSTEPRETRK